MKRFSPTRKLRVLWHAAYFYTLPPSRFLPPASSTALFELLLSGSQLIGPLCRVLRSAAQPPRTSTPLLPTISSVMVYTVSLRTHEIGIRMALGAQHRNILRLVLLNGLRLVAGGILIGLLASYALTRFLASEISGVSTTDTSTFAAVIALILLVGLAACLLPARHATQTDPLVALRYE